MFSWPKIAPPPEVDLHLLGLGPRFADDRRAARDVDGRAMAADGDEENYLAHRPLHLAVHFVSLGDQLIGHRLPVLALGRPEDLAD